MLRQTYHLFFSYTIYYNYIFTWLLAIELVWRKGYSKYRELKMLRLQARYRGEWYTSTAYRGNPNRCFVEQLGAVTPVSLVSRLLV